MYFQRMHACLHEGEKIEVVGKQICTQRVDSSAWKHPAVLVT